MAQTASTMVELGTKAPAFALRSTEDQEVSLNDFIDAKGLVVMFICNHCPYVIHIAPALASLSEQYMQKGIRFVAINSNDTDAYPADSFEKMKEEKTSRGYKFPYLLDETQEVAKRYTAACTPDIFVFDQQHTLVYRGQFDDTRPFRISSGNYDSNKTPSDGGALKVALDNILSGTKISEEQIPSLGCNIKWKPGNEPDYFG